MHRRILIMLVVSFAFFCRGIADNSLKRLGDTVSFYNESIGMFGGGDYAPYWMTNNHYGLSTEENNAFIWRRALKRELDNDFGRKWQIGWGVEVSNIFTKKCEWIVQQMYADVQYKNARLSIGQKERPSEMLNPLLSSGGLASGMNARPIPQIRLEMPKFWNIPGTKDWLAVRAYIGYGMYTDNKWQRDFVAGTKSIYSRNSLYHTKAGFLKIGNEKKFPLTMTGGLEMNTQFGGTAYNVLKRADDHSDFKGGTVHMSSGLSSFWHALIPGGSDATDGNYSNREGNTVGAWHLSLCYSGEDDVNKEKSWNAKLYAQHMFEDESQMFWQYGWKDFLLGTEINLPKNPIVSTVVYEYLTTKDQSGPIYHDKTSQIPDQISALDNYYNHAIYGAWQHAGFGLGNGLLISPRYNTDRSISFKHNRIQAHHIGLMGKPWSELSYRILFSYEKSWGTYNKPLVDPQEGWTMFVQTTYKPHWLRNCGLGLAYGHNGGKLLGNSNGVQISFLYNVRLHTK